MFLHAPYDIDLILPTLHWSYKRCLSLWPKSTTGNGARSPPFSTALYPKHCTSLHPKRTWVSNPESSWVHAALRDDLGLGNDDGRIGSSTLTPATREQLAPKFEAK